MGARIMHKPLSYSQLNLFDTCARWYHFRKVEGLPDVSGVPLVRGGLLHKCTELYTQHCIANKVKTYYSIQGKILERAIAETTEERLKSDNIANPLNEQELQDVKEVFNTFVENHLFNDAELFNPVTELKVAFTDSWIPCDWDSEEAFFRAVLDFAYLKNKHCMVIVDYKSNQNIPAQSAINNNLQLEIYAFLMSRLYPDIEKFEVYMDYIRFGKRLIRRDKDYKVLPYTQGDLYMVKKRIERLCLKVINEKEYEPSVGSHCSMCPYINRCDKYQNYLELTYEPPITSHAEFENVANFTMILEASIKANQKLLKQYVKDNNAPVKVGSQQLGFVPEESFVVSDFKQVKDRLQRQGISESEIHKHVSLSKSNFLRLIDVKSFDAIKKFDPELFESGMLVEKTTSKFKYQKIEEKGNARD
jgi:hypothetical protein